MLILSPDANYDEIFDDPMWQTVSAVQTGRVYEVPGEPYPWLGRPPSVQRVLGLKWLGNLLYPELFDDDMIEETQRFSHREENLIDQMIQAISWNLLLPKWLEEDARSIGWCTFLDVYQKYPAQFLWTGVGGWARAYLEIQTELHAFQVQETARYYGTGRYPHRGHGVTPLPDGKDPRCSGHDRKPSGKDIQGHH